MLGNAPLALPNGQPVNAQETLLEAAARHRDVPVGLTMTNVHLAPVSWSSSCEVGFKDGQHNGCHVCPSRV